MNKLTFRVYGRNGHRQSESFYESHSFETWDGSKIEVLNSDKTGTNDYSEVIIEVETRSQAIDSLWGQVTDGTFEYSAVGKVVEVVDGKEIEVDLNGNYIVRGE